ncbi:hypothetical protein BUALT_Bualt08G0006400 [Buddleja alternifolia]|uniref:C2 NT-type domain-containing protein n=1 Tax=Buddleja alternifolia TaxID=168488 RepID=A0AAV6XA29_9LAMI|nr:hypothetical protein BUALT_Bualt08G0006400 [Buddleja alternifolia]
MAADYTGRRNSNTQILQELETLSETLYQSHTSNRRTASLALPRTAIPPIPSADEIDTEKDGLPGLNPKPRSRRMSLSPWRTRPKQEKELPINNKSSSSSLSSSTQKKLFTDEPSSEKKGFLSWKPIRALAHIGMQKLSCLFSVEVVTVQSLPSSMNGLRLSVCVRKKESKDGVVQTMPSRVSQGAADFEETLFIRCHVYFTPGSGTHMKFEPRPFLVYVVAVDAEELDFGRSVVDLSGLIQESIDKSFEGARIRQWDSTFNLSGKAKGGELVLKLGFQIMEKDGGIGIYSQAEGQKGKKYSPSIARKQSKSSFSVPSPRMSSRAEAWTPSQKLASSEFQEMDDLNLDEPAPPVASVSQKSEEITETKMDDGDLLDFDVVDKGVEKIEDKKDEDEEEDEERSEEYSTDKRSVSSEVVKEVVQDQSHVAKRLTELDSIAQQIKVLESMMGEEKRVQKDEETASQTLDADEDKVTREFLQMLESDGEDDSKLKINYNSEIPPLKLGNEEDVGLEEEFEGFISDLGKGLGSVVQTRNGGYLAAMNPLDNVVARKDTPKLAMQMSKPIIIQSKESGFEKGFRLGFGICSNRRLDKDEWPLIALIHATDEEFDTKAYCIAVKGKEVLMITIRITFPLDCQNCRTSQQKSAPKKLAVGMFFKRREKIEFLCMHVDVNGIIVVDGFVQYSITKCEKRFVKKTYIQLFIPDEWLPDKLKPHLLRILPPKTHINEFAIPPSLQTSDAVYGELRTLFILSFLFQLMSPMRHELRAGARGPPLSQAMAIAVGDEERTESWEDAHMNSTKKDSRLEEHPTQAVVSMRDNKEYNLTKNKYLKLIVKTLSTTKELFCYNSRSMCIKLLLKHKNSDFMRP